MPTPVAPRVPLRVFAVLEVVLALLEYITEPSICSHEVNFLVGQPAFAHSALVQADVDDRFVDADFPDVWGRGDMLSMRAAIDF